MSGHTSTASHRGLLLTKRVVDILASVILLVILFPALIAVAVAVWAKDGSPVFFRQSRPGLDEKVFVMYKFRTMRNPMPGEIEHRTDSERVTKLGVLLRRTSVDELPELLNVLRGEMSLIGPRPLLVDYLPNYSEKHRKRHSMRPGMTGLAQVSGRRSLTFGQRLDLDVHYVENWSPSLDGMILLRTLWEPFRGGAT